MATTKPRTKPPPNAFDQAVGARIVELRKAAGLTPDQLAEKIERSPSQVFRYQSGDTSVDPETMAALASALGCNASDIIDGIRVGK